MKPGFEKFNYLVIFTILALAISKTMIFIDIIDTVRKIVIDLQGQLILKLHNKSNMLILEFSINLIIGSQIQSFKDFCNSNTWI